MRKSALPYTPDNHGKHGKHGSDLRVSRASLGNHGGNHALALKKMRAMFSSRVRMFSSMFSKRK